VKQADGVRGKQLALAASALRRRRRYSAVSSGTRGSISKRWWMRE
jgi:hypothetical protein